MMTVDDVRARMARRVAMAGVQVARAGTKWSFYYKPEDADAYEQTTDVAGMSETMADAELARLADVSSAAIAQIKASTASLVKSFASTFMKGSDREVRRTL